MISKRRDCRGRKSTTVLHGGVRHVILIPHKSGNKMEKIYVSLNVSYSKLGPGLNLMGTTIVKINYIVNN